MIWIITSVEMQKEVEDNELCQSLLVESWEDSTKICNSINSIQDFS